MKDPRYRCEEHRVDQAQKAVGESAADALHRAELSIAKQHGREPEERAADSGKIEEAFAETDDRKRLLRALTL